MIRGLSRGPTTVDRQPPIRTTRDRIIETAARLFTSRGFHQTSIDEIAQEAGVAKGSVYYHFSGKDQLLVCVIEEGVRLIRETVKTRLKDVHDDMERLLIVLGTAYDVMIEYRELATFALVGGCEGVSTGAKKQIDEAREAFEADVATMVKAVAGESLDPAFATSVLVGALEGAVRAAGKGPSLARAGSLNAGGGLGRGSRGNRSGDQPSVEESRRLFLLMCEKALMPGVAREG